MRFPVVSRSELEQIQQLMHRDRQRKLLALLVFSGVTGAVVYVQAVWLLAVLATGLLGVNAWQRRQPPTLHRPPMPPDT